MNEESMEITLDLKYFSRGELVRLASSILHCDMPNAERIAMYDQVQLYRQRNKETTG